MTGSVVLAPSGLTCTTGENYDFFRYSGDHPISLEVSGTEEKPHLGKVIFTLHGDLRSGTYILVGNRNHSMFWLAHIAGEECHLVNHQDWPKSAGNWSFCNRSGALVVESLARGKVGYIVRPDDWGYWEILTDELPYSSHLERAADASHLPICSLKDYYDDGDEIDKCAAAWMIIRDCLEVQHQLVSELALSVGERLAPLMAMDDTRPTFSCFRRISDGSAKAVAHTIARTVVEALELCVAVTSEIPMPPNIFDPDR